MVVDKRFIVAVGLNSSLEPVDFQVEHLLCLDTWNLGRGWKHASINSGLNTSGC